MGGGAEAGRQAPSVATRAAGCRHWGVDTGALTAGCGGSFPVPGTQEASVASVATGTYLIEDISPGTVAS
ncbi:unnamed protein product [Rangifer tarandus platyrhynchus]|uniref:Uncharacterized protein n=1 Tax=Rangifer tarandus platyrhynchus TaxID=3082113 RepID=A0AC59Z1X3_RANTA